MDENEWLNWWYSQRLNLLKNNLLEYNISRITNYKRGDWDNYQLQVYKNTNTSKDLSIDHQVQQLISNTKLYTVTPTMISKIKDPRIKAELEHGLENPGYIDGLYYPLLGVAFKYTFGRPTIGVHELTHGITLPSELNKAYNIMLGAKLRQGIYPDDYYDNEDEVKSRIKEFQKENNLDPTHLYTEDEIENMRKNAIPIFDTNRSKDYANPKYLNNEFKNAGYTIDFDILNRYDNKTILHLLNDLASNSNSNFDSVSHVKLGGQLNYLNYIK